jgi:hypothetical protein
MLARFAFQACTFNRSVISPFKINHLQSRLKSKIRIVIDLLMSCNHLRTLPV